MSELYPELNPSVEPLREQSIRVYRAMLEARLLENKLSSLYKAGKIVGGVYLGKGQEAVSASLGAQLRWGTDFFAPLIRDQAGRQAFGEPIEDCIRSYLGSALGPMRGRDGNIHRGRPEDGYFAMISHLGSAVAMVAGALMACRMQGRLGDKIGATCIGDGGTSTGAFHEGLNLAAVERLPLLVVVANNQFAYSTPTDRQFACENLIDRAMGYGVQGHSVDGTDFMACVQVMRDAAAAARAGQGPQLIEAKLLRLSGHGEHDDASYVPHSLRMSDLGNDCLQVAEQQLVERCWIKSDEIEAWKREFSEHLMTVVAQVQREPVPDPKEDDWISISESKHRDQMWNHG